MAGFDAYSCDLKEAEPPSWSRHIQGDVMQAIEGYPWDLIICHPPCTSLSVSGNHVYAQGKPRYDERLRALRWTEDLWNLAKENANHVAFENPVGVLHLTSMGKPTQYIQPYEFGDDASKKTGLWLYNLPPLVPTNRVRGRMVNGLERFSNQTDSGQNRLGPSPERATERSRTYEGIADAMVSQWSDVITSGPPWREVICTIDRHERRA